MMTRLILPLLLLLLLFLSHTSAATSPSAPVPHAGLADLPPLLQFANGSSATGSAAAWQARRAEIATLLQQYYYGTFPTEPVPALQNATVLSSNTSRGVADQVVQLVFSTPPVAPPAKITIEVLMPEACTPAARCPLFLTQTNHRRWALAAVARGYAALVYPGADSNDQTDVFRYAYPNATWGLIARRAYLGMRALDYALAHLPQIDPSAVGVTGHSRNGKQSLIFAAWDSRITAVIDSSSGAPAMSPYRFTSAYTQSESPYGPWPAPPQGFCNCSCPRDTNDPRPKDPRCCWWLPSVVDYEGRENMLPIDSHGLLALIAPRAVASQTAYTDPCDPSFAVERTYVAAKAVYAYHGAPGNLKLVWRPGQHHGFDNIQLYFDFFDAAFGRGPQSLASFGTPQVLLHTFDWAAWNVSHAYVPPPSKDAPAVQRVL